MFNRQITAFNGNEKVTRELYSEFYNFRNNVLYENDSDVDFYVFVKNENEEYPFYFLFHCPVEMVNKRIDSIKNEVENKPEFELDAFNRIKDELAFTFASIERLYDAIIDMAMCGSDKLYKEFEIEDNGYGVIMIINIDEYSDCIQTTVPQHVNINEYRI